MRRGPGVSGVYWGKRNAGGFFKSDVKALGLTELWNGNLEDLRQKGGGETPGVGGKCVDIWKNTSGESGSLVCN